MSHYAYSSQISDGASSVILARRSWAEERGLKPIGRFVGTQVAGNAPDEMGISPIYAIPQLYKYTGIEQKDVDVFEINEAFASQTLHILRKLGLDTAKVNPKGGAIALGHPVGATGGRQTATLFAELERQDKELGIVSMCARYVFEPLSAILTMKSDLLPHIVLVLVWHHYSFESNCSSIKPSLRRSIGELKPKHAAPRIGL